MSDGIPTENEREPQARAADASAFPTDLAAAYALGYGDGERLVEAQGQDASDESLALVCVRYLAHAEARPASPADQAYLAGVRDAAADNLPSPPIEPYRHAA